MEKIDVKQLSDKILRLQLTTERMERTILSEKSDIATKIAHLTQDIRATSQIREELSLLLPTPKTKQENG